MTGPPAPRWGRSVLEPRRGHLRAPDEPGFGLCHALLVADLDPATPGFTPCSRCLAIADESESP